MARGYCDVTAQTDAHFITGPGGASAVWPAFGYRAVPGGSWVRPLPPVPSVACKPWMRA